MKFEDKYPDMKEIHDERDLMIKGREPQPCAVCKEPTPFVEISFEAHFCSEECLNKQWDDYHKALANSFNEG